MNDDHEREVWLRSIFDSEWPEIKPFMPPGAFFFRPEPGVYSFCSQPAVTARAWIGAKGGEQFLAGKIFSESFFLAGLHIAGNVEYFFAMWQRNARRFWFHDRYAVLIAETDDSPEGTRQKLASAIHVWESGNVDVVFSGTWGWLDESNGTWCPEPPTRKDLPIARIVAEERTPPAPVRTPKADTAPAQPSAIASHAPSNEAGVPVVENVAQKRADTQAVSLYGMVGCAIPFLGLIIWYGYTFFYAPVTQLRDQPSSANLESTAGRSQSPEEPDEIVRSVCERVFPHSQFRFEFLAGRNLNIYVSRKEFDDIPFPDRATALKTVGASWCDQVEHTFLPTVRIRDIRTGEDFGTYGCATATIWVASK